MSLLDRFFPRTLRCEVCGCRMRKLETGKGYIMLTVEQATSGEGPAEECQKCGRVYCGNCYPSRPNICVCGKRSLKLIKVRYFSG